MQTFSQFLLYALGSAFVGALVALAVNRIHLRMIEQVIRFRIQVGYYQSLDGDGLSLTITNVGLAPVQEYKVVLHHPQRGSLLGVGVFQPEPDQGSLVFPQHPKQWNKYRCWTNSPREPIKNFPVIVRPPPNWVETWFLRLNHKAITTPSFSEFNFRLVMRNSDVILFEDTSLGNYIAKRMYEQATGGQVEQEVPSVDYLSDALWWNEILLSYKQKKYLKQIRKEIEAVKK